MTLICQLAAIANHASVAPPKSAANGGEHVGIEHPFACSLVRIVMRLSSYGVRRQERDGQPTANRT
jgi:hypothetical protein